MVDLYKLNLHSHTVYSDGGRTVREMAQLAKNLGFCCHVITDHYYGSSDLSHYSLSKESFLKLCYEADQVSNELDFPIIVGAECGYNRMEEINVFGRQAILYLMNNGVSHSNYVYARKNYNCAMILNHPQAEASIKARVADVIDGFERCNSGHDMFSKRPIPKELINKPQYSNSDAHGTLTLDVGFNLVDEKIEHETHLIRFLKHKKPLYLYADGHRVSTNPNKESKPIYF